jgi:hypothetical protein
MLAMRSFIGALAIIVAVAAAVFFFGGFYDVAATEPNLDVVEWALTSVRTASINRHEIGRLDKADPRHAGHVDAIAKQQELERGLIDHLSSSAPAFDLVRRSPDARRSSERQCYEQRWRRSTQTPRHGQRSP